jgi:hypothetical protein
VCSRSSSLRESTGAALSREEEGRVRARRAGDEGKVIEEETRERRAEERKGEEGGMVEDEEKEEGEGGGLSFLWWRSLRRR